MKQCCFKKEIFRKIDGVIWFIDSREQRSVKDRLHGNRKTDFPDRGRSLSLVCSENPDYFKRPDT